jgi:predicted N-acetyltransferase YhbS
MKLKVVVIPARDEDVPAIVAIAREATEESDNMTRLGAFDDERAAAVVRGLMAPGPHAVLVAITDKEIVGGIMISATPVWHSKEDMCAQAFAWFVKKSERGKGVGSELARAAVEWSRVQGYKSVMLMALNRSTNVGPALMRHGFGLLECAYVMEL